MATKPTQLDKLWNAWGRLQDVVNGQLPAYRVRIEAVRKRATQR